MTTCTSIRAKTSRNKPAFSVAHFVNDDIIALISGWLLRYLSFSTRILIYKGQLIALAAYEAE